MARITTLRVPRRFGRQVCTLCHALRHATLIAGADLVVSGLGLPL